MIILELVLLDYFLFYFYPFLIALCVDWILLVIDYFLIIGSIKHLN